MGRTIESVMAAGNRADFGRRLRELREANDWSAQRLADVLNVEAGTSYERASITGWERGEYAPGAEIVHALEVVLDAPAELSPLLGYRESAQAKSRLDRIEEELHEIRSLLARWLEPDDPADGAPSR